MADSLGFTEETREYDNLIAGDFPIVTKEGTLLTGQNLTRGTLLGRVTASKKYVKSLAASSDGSEVPTAILAEDKDATSEDKKVMIYLTGEYNDNKVTFGTGHSAASTRDGLRAKSIFLKTPVKA